MSNSADPPSLGGTGGEPPHPPCSLAHVGLRPRPPGFVDALHTWIQVQVTSSDCPRPVSNHARISWRHEITRAREGRSYHRFAEIHGLGDAEPEAFGSMQRRVNVATRQQRADLWRTHFRLDQHATHYVKSS